MASEAAVSVPLSDQAMHSPISTRLAELERILPHLTPSPTKETISSLRNLANFHSTLPSTPYPIRKLAGVLILLHLNPLGELSLTLTTRSMRLRSHPGETALPGGRAEESDVSIEQTALREAWEEIGLPLEPEESLFHLTNLPPFTSRTMLVVVPVVYLLTSTASETLAKLKPNPDEVSAIFQLPLRAFLHLSPGRTAVQEEGLWDGMPYSTAEDIQTSLKKRWASRPPESPGTEVLEYEFVDLIWLNDRLYRMHSFSHPLSPSYISGLTADIIVTAALIAFYGLDEAEEAAETGEGKLGFVRRAEGQLPWREIVVIALAAQKKISARDQRTSTN